MSPFEARCFFRFLSIFLIFNYFIFEFFLKKIVEDIEDALFSYASIFFGGKVQVIVEDMQHPALCKVSHYELFSLEEVIIF